MKKTISFTFVLISLVVAQAAWSGQGKIYTWKDDKGQTHFGSQPPSNVKAQLMGAKAIPDNFDGLGTD